MVTVKIYINRKGDKNLPEKITTEADSDFFKEGEIIEFPTETVKVGNFIAIKVIKVTKQIITSITNDKLTILVHAERCY